MGSEISLDRFTPKDVTYTISKQNYGLKVSVRIENPKCKIKYTYSVTSDSGLYIDNGSIVNLVNMRFEDMTITPTDNNIASIYRYRYAKPDNPVSG
jgi:hypothetical protein